MSRFSDFIRNATEDEKREVYGRVMERAAARMCTCHPDPPRPCPGKYALSECRAAVNARYSEPK